MSAARSQPTDWGRPVVHWEIGARDPDAQARLYKALFHWDVGGGRIMNVAPGQRGPEPGPAGHIRQGDAPAVSLYVQVRDLRRSLTEAESLGATVVVEPF